MSLYGIEFLFTSKINIYRGGTSNKQNDRVYTRSSKEGRELVPGIERGNCPASMIVWWGGITSLHFYEKDVKTAARKCLREILINIVVHLNQAVFQ